MASKATNWSAVCWMTSDGSPDFGSVKAADPPTGTPDAEPMLVPLGTGAVVVVVAAPAPVVVVVGAVVVVDPPPPMVPEVVVFAAGAAMRPIPATAAASTAVPPATRPMTAPRESAPTLEPASATDVWALVVRSANQVSSAGAPAAPASTNGIQANTNTMSDPV